MSVGVMKKTVVLSAQTIGAGGSYTSDPIPLSRFNRHVAYILELGSGSGTVSLKYQVGYTHDHDFMDPSSGASLESGISSSVAKEISSPVWTEVIRFVVSVSGGSREVSLSVFTS